MIISWCAKDRTNEWLYTETQCINKGWSLSETLKIDDDINESWFAQKLASWNINFSIQCNVSGQKIIGKIISDQEWVAIHWWVCCM
jgi:hypothetical protein